MKRRFVRMLFLAATLIEAAATPGLARGADISAGLRSAAPNHCSICPAQANETEHVCCGDASQHVVRFVTVEPGVQLEVLDWGGDGETLVLLTGFGDNAHVFDNFAYQFTDKFHVIGITRRGFGRSSQPPSGYDVSTRARDTIRVLDALNIRAALFAGHSLAGEELSKLGADYPQRVKKLVYMDAYEYGKHASLRPLPDVQFTEADLTSIEHFAAVYVRYRGFRAPNSAIRNSFKVDAGGTIIDSVTPDSVNEQVRANPQQAEYERIKAPALGMFNVWTPQTKLPGYEYLTAVEQAQYDRIWPSYVAWQADAILRFRTLLKRSRVIELQHSNHYVYISDEAIMAREMRNFLLAK